MFLKELIFYFIFYLWSLLFFSIFSLVNFFSTNLTFRLSYFWSNSIIKLSKLILKIDFEIINKENLESEKIIVASNHQSAWETFFLYVLFRNPIFILKKELKKIPIMSDYFKKLGFIFVDRKSGLKSLRDILRNINENKIDKKRPIIIFPEGTRVKPGSENELASGIFILYKYLNLRILPIAHNSGKFWYNNRMKKKGGTIKVKLFPLIKKGHNKTYVMEKLNKCFKTKL